MPASPGCCLLGQPLEASTESGASRTGNLRQPRLGHSRGDNAACFRAGSKRSPGKQRVSLRNAATPIKVLPGADVPCHGVPAISSFSASPQCLLLQQYNGPEVKTRVTAQTRAHGQFNYGATLLSKTVSVVCHFRLKTSKPKLLPCVP